MGGEGSTAKRWRWEWDNSNIHSISFEIVEDWAEIMYFLYGRRDSEIEACRTREFLSKPVTPNETLDIQDKSTNSVHINYPRNET